MDEALEWLEADGLGGFASGTANGVRTRRYHALLLTATTPPTGRIVLVNGFDAFLTTPTGRWALTTQRYAPDVLHPDGVQRLASFTADPWPTWEFETPDGYRIRQEVVVQHGVGRTLVTWLLITAPDVATLDVRPFLSGRDYHSTHHENAAFNFAPERYGATCVWRPYDGVPDVSVTANAAYTHAPDWYRNFAYSAERERGLDDREDLASPGIFTWHLAPGAEAVAIFGAGSSQTSSSDEDAIELAAAVRTAERARRATFLSPIERAADAYLVRRGGGRSLVAGYPWFTDWGRDTFIAIRGLCIATGRLRDARDILIEWSNAVSEGMLPNRFPDAGESPEFNSVDASLWFIVAVYDLLTEATGDQATVSSEDRRRLEHAVIKIVEGYAAGTRYGIRADADALLAAGEPGVQLTWMDAKVGDRVITPRVGKPVEVQALWINALHIVSTIDDRWTSVRATAERSFVERFWNPGRSCLYDVVDVDHVRGTADPTIRPNQILAVGGLPFSVLKGERARQVVDVVERDLLTPLGLRSLAPSEDGYVARYEGGPADRDAIYHQGTVWPWLLGPFVESWVRARRNSATARRRADRLFIAPVLEHITARGLGHLCEIADAAPPFTPRGCPFQAWSLGEVLRVARALRGRGVTPAAPRAS
jgi:predicted glycogen debranching enzyme